MTEPCDYADDTDEQRLTAIDLIITGRCTGQCLTACDEECTCRCKGKWHGALLNAPVTDDRPASDIQAARLEYRALRLERQRRAMAAIRARKQEREIEADIWRAWEVRGLYGARRARRMTLAQLASASGVAPEQISRAEKYGNRLGLENWLHVLDALGLDRAVETLQPALLPSRPAKIADGRSDPSSYATARRDDAS
jgi:hypothetical protein